MSLSIKRIKLISDKIVPFSHPHAFVLPTAIFIMTSAVRLVVFQLTFVIVNFSLVNFEKLRFRFRFVSLFSKTMVFVNYLMIS